MCRALVVPCRAWPSHGGHRHRSLIHYHRPPPHDIPHHIDRLQHRLRRQVRIAHRHLRVVVTQQFLHLVQRPPGIDQETRVTVAQVVQPHFLQSDLFRIESQA